MITYRSEIDGLRAVAVMPVIFFHAGFKPFGGGFVGVDVFFVISGYLITSIILDEISAGKFTLAGFYERRARRILPALLVVSLLCVPFAWLWMVPAELENFSSSIAFVSLFVSNLLFARDSGYFAAASELKPLLHTWSLAVEEQFYLVYPLFLLLAWRLGTRWIVATLLVVAALSFSLSQWGLLFKPGELFFLSPARVWELLIGALVAFYLLRGVASTHRLDGIGSWSRQALSFSGLALIAYSVFSFDKNTPAPGTYTLIPALGTALIILWATPETFVGKLLSWRPLVGLGLISYSAYLWHQPLMAFFRLRSLTEPTEVMLLALVGGCLIFAYCTWRFIERPFRDREKISREHVVIFATSISGLLIALGLFGLINYGFYSRTLPDGSSYAALDRRLRINNGLGVACEEKFTLSPVCRTAAQPEILLWGDSYAMHLLPAILASQPNARVIQMTKNVCGPIYQLAPVPSGKYDLKWAAGCINFNNSVFDWIEQSNSIKYAVLSSPFSQYLSDESRYLSSDGIGVADPKVVLQYFLYTLELLKSRGIKPVVVSPPPQDGRDIGRCLARSKLFATNAAACNISAEKYKRVQAAVNNFLLEVSENFQVIWLADAVCEADVCKAMIDNSFIYRDKGHLSVEGSALLGKRLNFYARISQ